jgi:Anthranilate/para-aminobenzoate synthases component I
VERDGETLESVADANPLDFVQAFQGRFRPAPLSGLPRFTGGLAGYFGYDTVRYIERRLAGTQKPDVLGTPDVLLLVSEELAVVDNLSGKLYFIVYADPGEAEAYVQCRARLRELIEALRQPVAIPFASTMSPAVASSEFGEDNFKAAVEKAKRYIFDGDIMQVVLSQRMSQPFAAPPRRCIAPCAASIRRLTCSITTWATIMWSAHPRRFWCGWKATPSPPAPSPARARAARHKSRTSRSPQELLADPKERAEHVQLMDLGRNDVGRVAQTGTVKVTDNMMIERYSHVMHIVSNVEGKLKPGMDAIDVLKATFPAGTVSGAPKVRAMEIIDELEPTKRGIYAGAVGYLAFNGDMDVAIAIRTAVIKDNTLYVQAGAGIVADSVPDSEWMETQNKARAITRAAEMVLAGLDVQAHR